MYVFIRLRFSVEQLVAEMADIIPVILLKTWRSFYQTVSTTPVAITYEHDKGV